jgi:micrococcal nuclease
MNTQRTRILVTVVVVLGVLAGCPNISAQAQDCAGFDSQIWAQSVFVRDPAQYASLDPDGNGVACEGLPLGAAPALWTDVLPVDADPVTLASVTDGDIIRAFVDGINEPVRLILIDTPETRHPSVPVECFGPEATRYLTWLLSLGGQLYLETDVSNRDRYDRLLRYVWLDLDGEVYLVNEVMARSGYASLSTYPPDVRYVDQIREAAAFAREHEYGLWSACVADAASATVEQGFVPRDLDTPAWTLPGEPVPPSDVTPCVGIPHIALDPATQRETITYANGDSYLLDESPCPFSQPPPVTQANPYDDCAREPTVSDETGLIVRSPELCVAWLDAQLAFEDQRAADAARDEQDYDDWQDSLSERYEDPYEGERDPDYRTGP